ncbi:unnamed protein product [Rodentolepis nana]|uniref:Pre-mRNA-splicing factor 38 n=1 Tax=Rodentolepis nana TaxID=102285 RepID=A0A0R3TRU6_RODNA|nr:unnamed protein product [Rodentolepis nana]
MKMARDLSQGNEFEEDEEEFRPRGNNLKLWGNQVTMNINPMIHTNIIQSPYFKTNLIELKTYHEVIDEIYYKVTHLEPWERNSRRVGGQTGMCGGVRGVGAGGIVSTAYCLLFKLFTLKLTRKQLKGLLEHPDSPYIRSLGFMYIRYCLPPEDLWMWFSPYLDDEEEVDVRAGGGCTMTIGAMLEQFLTKLDWFTTLFPRIPVPVQKKIEEKLREYKRNQSLMEKEPSRDPKHSDREELSDSVDRYSKERKRHKEHDRDRSSKRRSRSREKVRNHRPKPHHRHRSSRSRSRSRDRGGRDERESSFDRDMRRAREKMRR